MTEEEAYQAQLSAESAASWANIRAEQAIREAKQLRRDYSLMQIDRNNLRSLLDGTEAKVDELHDKLEGVEAEAKALRARVAVLEAALRKIESHRRKCHDYDADVGDELRDFDVDDVVWMEFQARAALQGDKT